MDDSKPPYLPHHLITEILSWLPPETLVCFTTVCKLWSSTIVNPKFIQLHRSHFGYSHPNTITDRIVTLMGVIPGPSSRVLIPDSNPRNFPYSYELIDNRGDCSWDVSGFCNGLFCYTALGENSGPPVVLCNPSIRRNIPIPRLPLGMPTSDLHYSVGFDAVKNDYKVVAMSQVQMYPHGKSGVFSLNSNVWKRLDVEVPYSFISKYPRSIFLNGFIHWVIRPLVKNSNRCILFLDVHNEVVGTMQMPAMSNTKGVLHNAAYLSVIKGLLSIMVTEFDITKPLTLNEFYEVWTMNEYGIAGSWTKLFRVQLPGGDYFHGGLTFSGKILLGEYIRRYGNLVRVGEDEDESPRHISWSLYDPETLEQSNLCRTMEAYNSPFAIEASLELLDYAAGSLDKYRSILL